MPDAEALSAARSGRSLDRRILIAAATAADADALCGLLAGAGIEAEPCADPQDLCPEIESGAGAAIIAAELLGGPLQSRLTETLSRQPDWADFPLIVMHVASQAPQQSRLLSAFQGCSSHVVMLQRPVAGLTLLSALHAALQSRRRQYQVRDALERRARSEAALRASEARFRQLADAMPQLVWSADAEGRVDYFNRRLTDFTAIGREGDGSWRWQDLIAPEDLERTERAWRRVRRRTEPYQIEQRLRMADGSSRWHLTRSEPVCDAAGGVSRWYGTCTDVHDLKLAHQALDEANRRKDEFLATLAHELRNPLAPISNAVEVFKLKGSLDPVLESARDTIDRQLRHMVRLIDDLLDVSRITRGRLLLRRERVALAAVLEQALEASRPHVQQAGHRLSVALPPEPVYLDADPVRLAQVFLNLINNACKYTAQGGTISLSAETDAGGLLIKVTDTGIGIAPEDLPAVFDMFSQVHSTLKVSGTGLGIGLALARGVVQMHGGSITAHSEGPGRGSEFRVRLPVLAGAPPERTAVDPRDGATVSDARRRVLIADDNQDIVESLAMVLELKGHEVQTARNGLEAVEVAERCRPDVVLLDIGMPQLNGYAACRRIRAQPWAKPIRIIAMTGWGQDDDRRKASDAGFNAHLVKPVDLATLLELLEAPQPADGP